MSIMTVTASCRCAALARRDNVSAFVGRLAGGTRLRSARAELRRVGNGVNVIRNAPTEERTRGSERAFGEPGT
jgi:hypothetical protein